MLILLPPSEGKAAPARGRPLSLSTLSFPDLTATRASLLDAVVRLAGSDPGTARAVLGLTDRQDHERARDAALLTAHCAPAAAVYTGVLYDALSLSTLPAPAKRRAITSLVISSALFGALRIRDRIPAYRLSAAVSLPGLGPVTAIWRTALSEAMATASGRGLVVDLRSSTYAAMWHPTGDVAARTVTVRVLQQLPDGRRQVVSHFNKATKGRLVRSVLVDGSAPRDAPAFAALCESYGYVAELQPAERGRPQRLDVVVTEV